MAPGSKTPTAGRNRYEHTSHAPQTPGRARHLRREMTASEKKLWAALRKLDLNIRRQAPIDRYIADFAQHSARLVIEVDGSRHNLETAQLHDAIRDDWLRSQGYEVIRIEDGLAYGDPWSVAERVGALVRQRLGRPNTYTGAEYASSVDSQDPPPPNPPPLRRRAS